MSWFSPLAPDKFECIGQGRSAWYRKAELSVPLIQKHQGGSPMEPMYYIGLDIQKKISY